MIEKQTKQKKFHYFVDFSDVPLFLFESSRCLAEVAIAGYIHPSSGGGKSPTNTRSVGFTLC